MNTPAPPAWSTSVAESNIKIIKIDITAFQSMDKFNSHRYWRAVWYYVIVQGQFILNNSMILISNNLRWNILPNHYLFHIHKSPNRRRTRAPSLNNKYFILPISQIKQKHNFNVCKCTKLFFRFQFICPPTQMQSMAILYHVALYTII